MAKGQLTLLREMTEKYEVYNAAVTERLAALLTTAATVETVAASATEAATTASTIAAEAAAIVEQVVSRIPQSAGTSSEGTVYTSGMTVAPGQNVISASTGMTYTYMGVSSAVITTPPKLSPLWRPTRPMSIVTRASAVFEAAALSWRLMDKWLLDINPDDAVPQNPQGVVVPRTGVYNLSAGGTINPKTTAASTLSLLVNVCRGTSYVPAQTVPGSQCEVHYAAANFWPTFRLETTVRLTEGELLCMYVYPSINVALQSSSTPAWCTTFTLDYVHD